MAQVSQRDRSDDTQVSPERQDRRSDPAGVPAGSRPAGRLRAAIAALPGDLSGAFADLGTVLPLTIGVLMLGGLDATGVLIGFGLFALVTAAVYRRPVPVQPMKAVAAIAIATGLSAQAIGASGIVIGSVLVALAVSGGVSRLARAVPKSVLAGLQFGIGLQLVWFAFGLAREQWLAGLIFLVALIALQRSPVRHSAAILMLSAGVIWALASGQTAVPDLAMGVHLPMLSWPAGGAFVTALSDVALAQIALTLTNAVLATAALAAHLFPGDTGRISPKRLALSTGVLNLALAPFGALPMCHGAGGLAVQHRFGARTGLAPAIFGIACLGLGILFGGNALALLMMVPMAVLGAFLALAGAELAMSPRLFDGKPSCLVVIAVTGAVCLFANVAAGLAAGFVTEALRVLVLRQLRPVEARDA